MLSVMPDTSDLDSGCYQFHFYSILFYSTRTPRKNTSLRVLTMFTFQIMEEARKLPRLMAQASFSSSEGTQRLIRAATARPAPNLILNSFLNACIKSVNCTPFF